MPRGYACKSRIEWVAGFVPALRTHEYIPCSRESPMQRLAPVPTHRKPQQRAHRAAVHQQL